MLENAYQAMLIKKIEKIVLPGSMVLKNDTSYRQGIPDLTVFYYTGWGWLEVKKEEGAPEQPNQDWYIDWANGNSFGAFIYPENEREVLRDLQRALRPGRSSRLS